MRDATRSQILSNSANYRETFFDKRNDVVDHMIMNQYRIKKKLGNQQQAFQDVILERNTVWRTLT